MEKKSQKSHIEGAKNYIFFNQFLLTLIYSYCRLYRDSEKQMKQCGILTMKKKIEKN